ncbi:hypothetical protein [Kitasatospora purpeofusca]|uniref:hypothetical protein n=1 Tax=Kitasatospora purpeofusca TaxID=67352 RepID=UPI0036D42928
MDYASWDPAESLGGDTLANNVLAPAAALAGVFSDAAPLGGHLAGLPVPARYHDNRLLVPHRGSDNGIWAYQQMFT